MKNQTNQTNQTRQYYGVVYKDPRSQEISVTMGLSLPEQMDYSSVRTTLDQMNAKILFASPNLNEKGFDILLDFSGLSGGEKELQVLGLKEKIDEAERRKKC